ncbi:MAG: lysophospholipid acyltransferase family protein [Armatimonadota bacterium]|nr:lysophospholipid acyltransferase family protein [Armatimonadota bacterium]MDR7485894.1 lysophospholipid acyltransferase family protein [Armatimonadota bacterium]MDR7533155.1 lysophospholipid acyltransferase family protein [Armatimonadota bacterium]MDR7536599.1 lysophospholipid acyltransferase family protein [Armatimonadota bacterium]
MADATSPFPGHTWRFWLTHRVVGALLRVLVRLRVEGREHYPAGPAVLVANHPSALDPLFIAAAAPERILFVAAAEFLAWRGVGWVMRAYGCIPVRRGDVDLAAVRQAVQALAAGRKVGVFPEGRVAPEPLPPRRGAAVIAARGRAPVVPVAVAGSGQVFPLGARLPRPGPVRVRFGPPLPPPAQTREAMDATLAAAMAWVGQHAHALT